MSEVDFNWRENVLNEHHGYQISEVDQILGAMNPTTPEELRKIGDEIFELSFTPREDVELESRARMAVNSLMDGDAGPAFTRSMKGALSMISDLYRRLAMEMEARLVQERQLLNAEIKYGTLA